MKKMMTALVALFAFVASANAMSYEQARQQALFLTDKMAYELNLTEEQYEAAYEVNLDYLMGVNTQDDLYGVYWERRNLDLSYILLDWQYQLYLNASYFYRPLYWNAGFWHFGIYARYPHRDYFYFGRPHFYSVYRGGHSWHMNGGHSWYHGRTFAPTGRGRNEHFGMHNRFERGDYGHGSNHGGGGNHYGNHHNGRNHNGGNHNGGGFHNGNNHSGGNSHSGFGGHSNNDHNFSTRPGSQESSHNSTIGTRSDRNFGNSRQSSTRSTFGSRSESFSRSQAASPRSTFTPERSTRSEAPSRSFSTPSRSSSAGSSVRSSSSTPSRSFGSSSHSSTPSRSFGSSSHSSSSTRSSSHSSAPSRSFSGSSSHGGSHSGGSHGGGGHFGGRR